MNDRCTCPAAYAYSSDEVTALYQLLVDRYASELSSSEISEWKFKLFLRGREIQVSFSKWVTPGNQVIDVSYVLCCIHEDDKPRGEAWEFYYISMVRPERPDLRDPEAWKWTVEEIADKVDEYLTDSLRPADERKYKLGSEHDGSGGGWLSSPLAAVSSRFIDRRLLKQGASN